MKVGKGLPLKAHLALFCLICFIPACIAVAVVGLNVARGEQRRVEREAVSLTQEFDRSIDAELSALTRVLQVLATARSLRKGDLATFRDQMIEVANANATAIALREPSGQHLVSTALPLGTTPMPVTNDPVLRRADAEVVATAKPVVSDVYIGATAGKPYISVVVPVVDGGAVRYLLTMAITPDRIVQKLALGALAQQGWLSSVTGSDGRILARTRDLDRFLGQAATGSLADVMSRAPTGTLLSVTLDGVDVFSSYRRGAYNWTTVVSVPVAVLERPVKNLIRVLLLVAAVALAATGLGAFAYGSVLGRQVALLAGNARRMGEHVPLKDFQWFVTEIGVAEQAIAEASRRTEDLLRELDHRVKNTLSIIQALTARTVRDPSDRETLTGRVAALAHAHEALSRRRWGSVPLADLVDAVCTTPDRMLSRAGPPVMLLPRTTTALAQVFNELWAMTLESRPPKGTAAADLSWTVENGRIVFVWRGPGLVPPSGDPQSQLARKIVELAVVRQLNGTLSFGEREVRFAVPLESEFGVAAHAGDA